MEGLSLLFVDMFGGVAEQGKDMIVVQRVKRLLAVAPTFNEPLGS